MNYWLDLSKNGLKTVKLVSFLFVNQLKLFLLFFYYGFKLVEFADVFGNSAISLPKSFTKCALLWFLEDVLGNETQSSS